MKVLMINGSPHEHGCTAAALEVIAEELKFQGIDHEHLWVGNKAVQGCIGCWQCKQKGGACIFNDEINEWITKMNQSDGLVIGFPVHFASATGPLITMLDRFFTAGGASVAFKPGAVICSARRAGTTATFDQLMKYLMMNSMVPAPSPYWNMIHGNTPEEIFQDKEGIYIMKSVASGMAWLLHMIEKNSNMNEKPKSVEKAKTNFIR